MTFNRVFNMGQFAVLPLAAAAIIASSAVLKPAQSAEPALSDNMYAAIYAEEQCGKGGKFSQEQWQRLVTEVGKRWGVNFEAGDMLKFVDDTDGKVASIRRKYGCNSAELEALRAKFSRDLKPLL